MLGAAAAILAVHSLAELVLRRGRARSFARGRFDRGTTLLTTLSWPSIVLGALAARFFVDAGRLPPAGGLGFALLVVMAAGASLRWWAMHTLGEYFTRTLTVLDGQRLIETGPYRWIRHPGYLAQLLVHVPFAALLSEGWIAALGALALLAAVYTRRIRLEEAMLAERLGRSWVDYAERTWRLVPGLY
jgi:protein-S-isoprenylcysteine O-methyltransferase Ste14